MADNKKKRYGEYDRTPDNVFETYNENKYRVPYRSTNALVFPLKLIPGEEVFGSEELSGPLQPENPDDRKK